MGGRVVFSGNLLRPPLEGAVQDRHPLEGCEGQKEEEGENPHAQIGISCSETRVTGAPMRSIYTPTCRTVAPGTARHRRPLSAWPP